MRAYEKTDFLESLEAGTLLLKSSNAEGYVEYTSEDGRTMRYLPYLPPNCYLMPIVLVGNLDMIPMIRLQQMSGIRIFL